MVHAAGAKRGLVERREAQRARLPGAAQVHAEAKRVEHVAPGRRGDLAAREILAVPDGTLDEEPVEVVALSGHAHAVLEGLAAADEAHVRALRGVAIREKACDELRSDARRVAGEERDARLHCSVLMPASFTSLPKRSKSALFIAANSAAVSVPGSPPRPCSFCRTSGIAR